MAYNNMLPFDPGFPLPVDHQDPTDMGFEPPFGPDEIIARLIAARQPSAADRIAAGFSAQPAFHAPRGATELQAFLAALASGAARSWGANRVAGNQAADRDRMMANAESIWRARQKEAANIRAMERHRELMDKSRLDQEAERRTIEREDRKIADAERRRREQEARDNAEWERRARIEEGLIRGRPDKSGKPRELAGPQLEQLNADKEAVRLADSVASMFQNQFAGPVSARWSGVKSAVGIPSANRAAMESELEAFTANGIHTLYGANLVGEELKKARRQFPNLTDPSEEFISKLQRMSARVKAKAAERRATYEGAGFDLSAIPMGGTIEFVRDPSGKLVRR